MRKMEKKIKQAFESATPDVLDRVLSRCPAPKESAVPAKPKKRKALTRIGNIAASIGIVVLLFGVGVLIADILLPEKDYQLAYPPLSSNHDNQEPVPGTLPPDTGVSYPPDATSPNGVHYYTAFMFTDRELHDLSMRIIFNAYPQFSFLSISPDYSYSESDGIRSILVSYGETQFFLELDVMTGRLQSFGTSFDTDAVFPEELDLIPKQKIWSIVNNLAVKGDPDISLDTISDLQITLELSADSNTPHKFEVSFIWSGFQYQATVDAITGEILNANFGFEVPPSLNIITEEEVIAKSLSVTNASMSKVEDLEVNYINDSENPHYHVRYAYSGKIYQFEIDTAGMILGFYQPPNHPIYPNTGRMYTSDEAIAAACDSAAIQDAEKLNITCSLLEDCWSHCYEVKFVHNNALYRYVIDAYTLRIYIGGLYDPILPEISARQIVLEIFKTPDIQQYNIQSHLVWDTRLKWVVDIVDSTGSSRYTLDAYNGTILEVSALSSAEEVIDREKALHIAFEEAGELEGYLNGEYQVYCKLYQYEPLPLYEISFDVMHNDIGYCYSYIVDAGSGEIMLAYHGDRDNYNRPMYLKDALDLCMERVTGKNLQISYAKLNLDSAPYYYISITSDTVKYAFQVDVYTYEVTQIGISIGQP